VESSPAVANGVVYAGSWDGKRVRTERQHRCQAVELRNRRQSRVLARGGQWVVYVGSGGYVYALDASTGTKLWSYLVGGNHLTSSPAVANGVVYVGSWDLNLYALNAKTGARLWRYRTGWYVESSPAVANGMVYVGSGDSKLYAFGLK